MPPFVQNALTRLVSGQLLSAIFNPGSRQDQHEVDLHAELTEGLNPTEEEYNQVNGRYNLQA